jgi:hypothetical protein
MKKLRKVGKMQGKEINKLIMDPSQNRSGALIPNTPD